MKITTSIIDRLLVTVEKRYNVQDDMKLVLLLKSLSPKFDQQKTYILANQNTTLKKAATSLAGNEFQILRDYTTGLEIETTIITAKMKQGQSKLAIAGKNKIISAILIKDVEYQEYHKKGCF